MTSRPEAIPPPVTTRAPAVLADPQAQAAAAGLEGAGYAGLVTRALAFAIDSAVINGAAILVVAVVALGSAVFPIPKDAKTVLVVVGGATYVIWSVAYFVAFWAASGRTLGNRVMYVRVAPADGGKLGYPRALRRFIGLVLAVIPLFAGLVPILVNDRRRGLHDRIANTVVVHDPERRAPRPGPSSSIH